MRIIVENIECGNNCIFVTGDTNIGKIKGIWRGRETPILRNEYSVELDIDNVCRSDISVIDEQDTTLQVCLLEDKVLFKGVCEEIDDIYVIRFAIDWIEMIEVENDDFSIKKNDYISFVSTFKSIKIYPY